MDLIVIVVSGNSSEPSDHPCYGHEQDQIPRRPGRQPLDNLGGPDVPSTGDVSFADHRPERRERYTKLTAPGTTWPCSSHPDRDHVQEGGVDRNATIVASEARAACRCVPIRARKAFTRALRRSTTQARASRG